MEPFDLEKALKGKPVQLRNGNKGIIIHRIPNHIKFENGSTVKKPLIGYILNSKDKLLISNVLWCANGSYYDEEQVHNHDIVGMWKEPELSSDEVLEKAYKENLRVTFPKALLTDGYEVIAKTKHGSYIIRNGSYIVDSAVTDETYSLFSNQEPTINLEDLPKPFTPEETQHYYYINGGYVECEDDYVCRNVFDKEASKNGNCFRTREDATKWLDFMSRFKE